jgi:hypothetical protein
MIYSDLPTTMTAQTHQTQSEPIAQLKATFNLPGFSLVTLIPFAVGISVVNSLIV